MKRFKILFTVMVALALVAFGTTATQARPVSKTTGSVELSGPMQYMSFDAFESNPVKGSVRYTNFEYGVDGTGVWVPDNFAMGFGVDPSTDIVATYMMTVDSFRPTSPTSVTFNGTGAVPGWISTFTGSISGDDFSLTMTEINAGDPSETYNLTAYGSIAADGSVSGTWQDNYGGGRTGTFSIADIGHEVFSYVAPVTAVDVDTDTDAFFSYVIPQGIPYGGTAIYVLVHDGGSPGAGNDTLSFGTTMYSLTSYTIESGNLNVFI